MTAPLVGRTVLLRFGWLARSNELTIESAGRSSNEMEIGRILRFQSSGIPPTAISGATGSESFLVPLRS